MRTSQLNQIMRQKDSELLNAVQHLARGKTEEGVRLLREQGRVIEVKDRKERIAAIAKNYVARPDNTIIVSPDNRSRQAITLRSDFCKRSIPPEGIRYTGEPIDCESLHRKQDHRSLDNEQFFGLRNDAQRNDERRSSRRRMAYPQ